MASALGAARHRVRTFLCGFGVPDDAVFDVVLSLDEACKNAIRFSKSPRTIDVTVAFDTAAVCLVVRDHGVGFEPPTIDTSNRPTRSAPGVAGSFSWPVSWTTCASIATAERS